MGKLWDELNIHNCYDCEFCKEYDDKSIDDECLFYKIIIVVPIGICKEFKGKKK